ncbi:MAG: 2-dehydropantoate 2-reductase [Rhodospirillaceae bacterium]|jgi:2-dehydropantoate 2-reductase|nr:2-dehydropantoate 2-reductase [Rhodospirillaceae bacterium]MBT5359702.1 2-dehydropantoate 2-reductase [Rhodospirillaceae bacterium]MBT5945825.1 2-dehydropantoate 2-reductase [Rhodospirillaceae bacterium]MBT6403357.1 2-dehydropantoate 2-reductase [Rhodospirillaceae bacterium]MBT7362280.1 2-dehydropantoate 2-reductase [Rhodospirillaceae bacterium]
MKVCIFGAGAIGGYMAVELADAGNAEVTCIARGPHLAAMRENGLRLIREDADDKVVKVRCTDSPEEAGPQDVVIVTLKAHSAAAVADQMTPLFGPDTAVVTAQNGVPWWYFYKHDSSHEDTRVASVDPGNRQWDVIGPERAIGCVVYPAAEITEPGVIRHEYGNRFTLGEPSGEKTERVQALAALFADAGLRAPVRPRIRDEIWVKLWGNVSLNPISALTGGTLAEMIDDPDVCAVIRAVMVEAQAVGEALGVKFAIDVDKRIAGARDVGDHKTSMLQDLELGRPMEIDALVASVQELGRIVDVSTPAIDTVLGLVRQRARLAGCYGA